MSARRKGKRGERRWYHRLTALGFTVKMTSQDETGVLGSDVQGWDMELTAFRGRKIKHPIRVQAKELAQNCPAPRGLLERANVAAIHFTTGSHRSRDVLVMQAEVFEELVAKGGRDAQVR